MLKYLELQRICDATFVLFLVSWLYTRHYLYSIIAYSCYADLPVYFHRDNHNSPYYQIIPPKGGGSWGEGYNWAPQQGYYFTYEVHMVFLALLAALQAIILLWFVMITRLTLRVLRGTHAEDDRSDDEDDGEDVEDVSEGIAALDVVNIPLSTNGVVSNGIVTNGITSTNGIASNGIHQRKTAG
jgi:very-long-chain ceramide synthase